LGPINRRSDSDAGAATDKYLGKVIHITPEGKPAPGNPALGLPEVWSMVIARHRV